MLIKTLPLGQNETNCYIVTDENTLECAVIDPGDESNVILDYTESNRLKPVAIFITHGHFDHVGAAGELRRATSAPVYIHRKDAYTGKTRDPFRLFVDDDVKYYGEGDKIPVGSMVFQIIETPGHSEGSVTLLCKDALFTGDALFKDSCGRTDLPGGNMRVLLGSLRRLYDLEGNYEVYPGHMDSTDLGRERQFNYYMKYAVENS